MVVLLDKQCAKSLGGMGGLHPKLCLDAGLLSGAGKGSLEILGCGLAPPATSGRLLVVIMVGDERRKLFSKKVIFL